MAGSALSRALQLAVSLAALQCAAGFAVGDTWTADLNGKTLPPGGVGLVKGKGSGTFTLTAAVDNLYYWEVNVYDITALTAIDLVLATSPDLPLVLQLTTEYLPDEISYFGNFTTDYLREQLAVHGVDERALVDNNLYLVVRQNATTGAAIAGAVNANAIADFVEEAPGPDSGEDFGSSVTADVVYVAQMQNSSVPLFESGFTEMSGTGTMLLQDMDDGTYEWTLDLDDRARHPKKLEIRYFAKLNYQPIVLTLVADPKLEDKVVSYAGNFTKDALNAGLASVGAIPSITFNTTPPVLFATLYDKNNDSLVGFVFNANSAPTLPPVIKGAAIAASAGLPTLLALLAVSLLVGM